MENYNYPIKNFLVKDVSLISDTSSYSQIILCVYTINTSGKYPFLQYLLVNNGFNILSLPSLPIYNEFKKENLSSYSKVYLSGVLQVENFTSFDETIVLDGFYEYEENLYLFFDITKYDLSLDEYHTTSVARMALIDEITNHRHLSNITISPYTAHFFSKNSAINFICDKNNKPYEIPIVGYVGKQTIEKMNFTYIFGETARNKSAPFGPYYYFTDYSNAISQEGTRGIVRFALFIGNTKYIQNSPNDPIDESLIKKERINDKNLDQKYEILTLRITDHDGLWANTYDTLYLGKVELDDGNFIEDYPVIVIKEYCQQVTLTSHFIDRSMFNNNYTDRKEK